MEINGVRFSVPEMIAAIYESRSSGKFGKIYFADDEGAIIDLAPDGKRYFIERSIGGNWVVWQGETANFGYGDTVEEAARNALDGC